MRERIIEPKMCRGVTSELVVASQGITLPGRGATGESRHLGGLPPGGVLVGDRCAPSLGVTHKSRRDRLFCISTRLFF